MLRSRRSCGGCARRAEAGSGGADRPRRARGEANVRREPCDCALWGQCYRTRYIMKIALHGSFMGDNFGDLLLLRLYTRWIKRISPEIEVVLPGASHAANRWIGADHVGWGKTRGVCALVYGPGGYLGAPGERAWRWSARNARRHLPPVLLARAMKVPWIVSGVGVGPLPNLLARVTGRLVLRGAESVTVRDVESSEYMDEIGLTSLLRKVSSDAAFLLGEEVSLWPEEPSDEDPKPGRRVGIHVTTHGAAPARTRDLLEGVASCIRSLAESDLDIVVFTDAGIGRAPTEVYSELRNLLPAMNMVNKAYEGPPETLRVIRGCDVVVTTKLHVGIVSLVHGIPVLAVGPHPKVDRLYRQLGMSDMRIALNKATPEAVANGLCRIMTSRNVTVPERIVNEARLNRDQLTGFLHAVAG
jgi:polysaccharide pyruvyl transferase WcaK-like protein